MLPSLKLKLVLAFGFVVVLTVVLTGAGSFYMLRTELVRTERERVGLLVYRVLEDVRALVDQGTSPEDIGNFLTAEAAEEKVRFFLIDARDERVVVDTQDELQGQMWDQNIERRLILGDMGIRFTTLEEGAQKQYIITPYGPRIQTVREERPYRVYLAVPESNINGAWTDLIPRLGWPALAALFVSGVIAYLLSRSIAGPVVDVTRASEAMARGQYDQRIEVEGRDEIGRLARSFNAMATRVSSSDRMMKDLLANVAHELKTPLTSIQGFSQALIEGAAQTPEDRQQAARIINDEAERMRRLVEDLLYLSQLESGQLRMEMGTVDVPDLLNAAAERVAWQLRDRETHFRVNIAPELATIRGDERRLEQVLANLLDNAARHTPAGGTVTLEGERQGGYVLLSVHNTGSYIPPDVLPRVFERFYRADPHRTRDGRHGGLGLSIAAEIVAAHGGRIDAASDPETGTTFRVFLPAPAESGEPESTRPGGITARLPLPVRRSA